MGKNITNLDQYLAQEEDALNKVLNQINKLCEQNQNLQDLVELQKEVKKLEKKHLKSFSWFKRLIKIVSQLKYIFIKSEDQLTKEVIKENENLLKNIDNAILSIADKSSPLKHKLEQELSKNFETLAKKGLFKDPRKRLTKLSNDESATKSEKFSQLPMFKPLHFSNAKKLDDQHNFLNTIKQNIQNLLTENSNIKEIIDIKKQVAEIRAKIPYTFFEKLNNGWQKIKNVFVDNNEQVLAKNKENNTKIIEEIDKQLSVTKDKFKVLSYNKENNIKEIINNLPKDMQYQIYNRSIDLKSSDFISPIIEDRIPKLATIKKINKKNIKVNSLKVDIPKIPSNLENSMQNTEEMHESLFGLKNLPTSEFSENKPILSSFSGKVPSDNNCNKILLDYIDENKVSLNIKRDNNSNETLELNDVKSILDLVENIKLTRTFNNSTQPSDISSESDNSKKSLDVQCVQQVLSGKKKSSHTR